MAWTAPRTWVAGEIVTAALLNTHIRDNQKVIGDPWTTYACVWSASGTAVALGNGVMDARYFQAGKWVRGRIFLSMGSTTTYGTGNYSFTLPPGVSSIVGSQWFPVGTCVCRDASATNTYALTAFTAGPTTLNAGTDNGGRIGQLVPFTWANTDTFGIEFDLEAA